MAKKTFDDAAMQFVSNASDLTEDVSLSRQTKELEALGLDTDTIEKLRDYFSEKGLKLVRSEPRTEKMHIQVTKTLATAIKKQAKTKKTSCNEVINEALENAFLFEGGKKNEE